MKNISERPIRPKIELWDSVGLGLIIEYPSGILFSNQTGGFSCLHPSVEGIYVPLNNDYSEPEKRFLSPEIDLAKYFEGQKYGGSGATKGIDAEDILVITEILKKYSLNEVIIVDTNKSKMQQSHEAWIYVKILNLYLLDGFSKELNGIMTWSNSD
ncbi:DUF6210 family protein [Pedobacter ureilyticus]|uniref:DUF6210 family protein n=1 Tax=Pedobacter ureilyticus TaxID=1393051 RepID=A0ABW9JAG5_9SPHI|nr:DUF6210 family protein [Pedobacter helvus]